MKAQVILATYNGEKYIIEQIKSILSAKLPEYFNLEIIVSDDNSSDNTIELINDHFKNESKVKILSSTRKGGVIENFKYLLKFCDGDLIFFSDQDDFWLPNKLDIFIKSFEEYSKKVDKDTPLAFFSDLCVVDGELIPKHHSMMKYQNLNKAPTTIQLGIQNSVTGCVFAINNSLKEIIKELEFTNVIMHDWYIALIAKLLGELVYIDKSTILYRQHGNNQVGAKSINLNYLLTSLKCFKSTFHKTVTSIYNTKLQIDGIFYDLKKSNVNIKNTELELYSNSFNRSFLSRLILFFFHGFRKKGFLRNLVFFFFYVFFINIKTQEEKQ